MATRVPTRRATFIPFGAMTAREQAEHLVLVHGMGPDYYGDLADLGLPSTATVADLVAWHERQTADVRQGVHRDDHEYLQEDPEILACRHTHQKPVQRDGGVL